VGVAGRRKYGAYTKMHAQALIFHCGTVRTHTHNLWSARKSVGVTKLGAYLVVQLDDRANNARLQAREVPARQKAGEAHQSQTKEQFDGCQALKQPSLYTSYFNITHAGGAAKKRPNRNAKASFNTGQVAHAPGKLLAGAAGGRLQVQLIQH
jgi:hypothetical protein